MISSKEKKYSILSIISKYGSILGIAFALLIPITFIYANHIPGHIGGDANTGIKIDSGIKNPLSSDIDTIPKFITVIIGFVLLVGVPIIVLAIIYAGFLFVTAVGNSEKLKKAKTTLLYTLIGAALLLGSYVIANAIKGTVDEITKTQPK